jgi:hypothetical protein
MRTDRSSTIYVHKCVASFLKLRFWITEGLQSGESRFHWTMHERSLTGQNVCGNGGPAYKWRCKCYTSCSLLSFSDKKQRTIISLATNYMQISTKTCDVTSCLPVPPWSHGNLSKNVKLHVLFGFFILMGIVQ